jgi:hypothetical protein
MTILSSASRQSELIPILCAIANFRVHPKRIDQLFQLPEGETRLLLRGLHSLLYVPSDESEGTISPHHASFLDFLNNLGRSRTFCVGTLQHRIDQARIILEAYVGPHENGDGFLSQYVPCIPKARYILHQSERFLKDYLMPFIQSLPPSAEVAELLPLIGTIDPECIFAFCVNNVPRSMLAWLKVSSRTLLVHL